MSEATWNEPGDNPRPVPAEQSIIPYDFPSFPLVDPGTDKPRSRLFEITQELPPLKFAKDILQREQTGLEPNRYAGKDIQERSGFKGMDPKQMIFVELSRKMDGYASRQIWAPELPWPLYSDNGNSRSVLIFHSLEARSTRSTPKTTGSTGAGDGPAPQGSETVRDEDAETR